MRAAVLTGVKQVRIEDRPEPEARPGWVVVTVESASLCGTDSHQYDGRIDTPFPRVPGHDFAGRVESVGDGVDTAWLGAPVAVKPSLPCDDCPECAAGKPLDCKKKKLIGLWSDGCLTEKVAVPVVNLVPRPEGVEAWQASLLEPLAVGLNTVDRLQIMLGETVLVLGQGPIGLALTGCAPCPGPRLIVTDARRRRSRSPRSARPTASTSCRRRRQAGRRRPDRCSGAGADIVIETSGFPASSAIVLDVVRKGGEGSRTSAGLTAAAAGHPDHGEDADRVRGGRQRRLGQYERSQELVRSGRIDSARW